MADAIKISLSFGERRFLLMLADRGRRVTLNPVNFKPEVKGRILEMKVNGLIEVNPVLFSDSNEYYLTDLGSKIVDDMKRRFKEEVEEARKAGSGDFGSEG